MGQSEVEQIAGLLGELPQRSPWYAVRLVDAPGVPFGLVTLMVNQELSVEYVMRLVSLLVQHFPLRLVTVMPMLPT